MTDFDRNLGDRLRRHAQAARRPFDATSLARAAMRQPAARAARVADRIGLWPPVPVGGLPRERGLQLAHLLLIGCLLAALAVSAVVMGSFVRPPHLPPATLLGSNGLIAFDGGGDIFVAKPDGSDRRRLTSGPARDLGPTWSPDGTKIAFWSEDANGLTLRLMTAEGSLLMSAAAPPGNGGSSHSDVHGKLAWSPDGKRIAFAYSVNGSPALFLLALDGNRLSPLESGLDANSPAWSHDGRQLAFYGGIGTSAGVYVMDPDTTGHRRIAQVAPCVCHEGVLSDPPSWSPDDTKILVDGTANGSVKNSIFVVSDEGTGLMALTSQTTDESYAAWSPDGTKIAFDRPGAWHADGDSLMTINPDGSGLAALESPSSTPSLTLGAPPIWSPDGTQLLAVDVVDGDILVWSLNGQTQPVVIPVGETTGSGSWQRLPPR